MTAASSSRENVGNFAAEVESLLAQLREAPVAARAELESRMAAELARVRSHLFEADDLPAPQFHAIDDQSYRMEVPRLGITLTIDHLRRERHHPVGELTVRCRLPGARTVGDGILNIADFNLTSIRSRQERAKYLAARAQTREEDLDWLGLLEELSQRVLAADRAGQPAVSLRDLPRPVPDDTLEVDGFPLLARQPVFIFGDGGVAKSYLSLNIAGVLAKRGLRVGYFDWELSGEDHRDRLERLFGADMPDIRYLRCDKPLSVMIDRVRRTVRDEQLDFCIFDSIAFACDGPPEAAEVAGRYFQSLRRLGDIGSLHVAHVSKAEGADKKPFGSTFWHNGARATWFVKLARGVPNGNIVSIGLYNRKANLGAIRPAVAFDITFTEDATTFKRVQIADVPDLAANLSIRHRMALALHSSALTPAALAEEIEADVESVKRTARRYRQQFTVLQGGKMALLENRR